MRQGPFHGKKRQACPTGSRPWPTEITVRRHFGYASLSAGTWNDKREQFQEFQTDAEPADYAARILDFAFPGRVTME